MDLIVVASKWIYRWRHTGDGLHTHPRPRPRILLPCPSNAALATAVMMVAVYSSHCPDTTPTL